MGIAPGYGLPEGPFPGKEPLERNTFVAFGDFDFAFGRQPAEELYELSTDPHQMLTWPKTLAIERFKPSSPAGCTIF